MTRILDSVINNGEAIVSGTHTAAATTITLLAGERAKLPDITDGACNLVWYLASKYDRPKDDPYAETVRYTATSGSNDIVVTRAQEGTTATAKNLSSTGYRLVSVLTAKMINDINSNLSKDKNEFVVGTSGSDVEYECDGTDDQVQIVEALADCGTAGGGIVKLLPGNYYIEPGEIPIYSNTKLICESGAIINLGDSFTAGTIFRNSDYVGGNESIEISIEVDGNHTNNDNDNAVWICNFDNVDGLKIVGNRIKNHYYSTLTVEGTKYSFQVWRSKNIEAHGNYFYRASRALVFRDCDLGDAHSNTGEELYLRFIEVSNDWTAPLGTYSTGFKVHDNSVKTIYSGDGQNGEPYYFKSDSVICHHNYAEDFYRFGIRFVNSDASYEQQYNQCFGNVLIANGSSAYGNHGIIAYRQKHIKIFGNTINGALQEGINCEFCSDLEVTGNDVSDSAQHGINIQNNADRLVVTNNIIKDCGGGTYHGIQVTDSTNLDIHDNILIDTNSSGSEDMVRGIYVYDVLNLNIHDNTVVNAKTYGIYCNNDIVSANIHDNIVREAKTYGIYVNDSSRLNIHDNHVTNCGAGIAGTGGIKYQSTKYAKVHDNEIRDTNAVGSKVTYDALVSTTNTDHTIVGNYLEYFGGAAYTHTGNDATDYSHNQEFTNTNND